MSKLASILGTKSLIIAAIVDLAGIIVSFLIDVNLTNTLLERIVFMAYCVRYELIIFFIFTIIGIIYIYILKRFPTQRKQLALILFCPIFISLICTSPLWKRYVISRFVYFKWELYQFESQKRYLNKAIDCYDQRNWEESIRYLTKAQDLYDDCIYTNKKGTIIRENVAMVNTFCGCLEDLYIKPIKQNNNITIASFLTAQTLYKIHPAKYKELYNDYSQKVSSAIDVYNELYKSIEVNDIERCKELVSAYGWCWFEPNIYNVLSNSKDQETLIYLRQYTNNEDISIAQKRLTKYWFRDENNDNICYKDFE